MKQNFWKKIAVVGNSLGIASQTRAMWKYNNKIPAKYHPQLLLEAQKLKVELDWQELNECDYL